MNQAFKFLKPQELNKSMFSQFPYCLFWETRGLMSIAILPLVCILVTQQIIVDTIVMTYLLNKSLSPSMSSSIKQYFLLDVLLPMKHFIMTSSMKSLFLLLQLTTFTLLPLPLIHLISSYHSRSRRLLVPHSRRQIQPMSPINRQTLRISCLLPNLLPTTPYTLKLPTPCSLVPNIILENQSLVLIFSLKPNHLLLGLTYMHQMIQTGLMPCKNSIMLQLITKRGSLFHIHWG